MQKTTPHIDLINNDFKGKDILTLDQFDPTSLQTLFTLTDKMASIAKNAMPSDLLKGNIVSLLFYEPSSRTFSSFSAGVKQLSGATLEFHDMNNSSVAKGESLVDTIRVFEAYSDAIVLRHPIQGSAQIAANTASSVPIINAGDGIGEHPTQALLDLYTIYKKFNRLDNLTLLIAGDLLNGRTIHSLLIGLSLFKGNTVYLLAPSILRLAKADFALSRQNNLKLIEIESEEQIPKNANIWYWTRVQKERFSNLSDYEKIKHAFVLTPSLLKKYGNEDLIIMHPLPRVGEIDPAIDSDKRAIYLKDEIRSGMYLRMALLALLLGKSEF